jgi:hypothetical protein
MILKSIFQAIGIADYALTRAADGSSKMATEAPERTQPHWVDREVRPSRCADAFCCGALVRMWPDSEAPTAGPLTEVDLPC